MLTDYGYGSFVGSGSGIFVDGGEVDFSVVVKEDV